MKTQIATLAALTLLASPTSHAAGPYGIVTIEHGSATISEQDLSLACTKLAQDLYNQTASRNVNEDGSVTLFNPRFQFGGTARVYKAITPDSVEQGQGICIRHGLTQYITSTSRETVGYTGYSILVDQSGLLKEATLHSNKDFPIVSNITCR